MATREGVQESDMVRVHEVHKRVSDGSTRRSILQDVSFTLPRGTATALRGPSGSGKTTLLAITGTLLAPTSGEVFLDGEPTARLRDRFRAELRRTKVGIVFQDLELLPDLDAMENVLLPAAPIGVDDSHRERAAALLGKFGLGALVSSNRSRSGVAVRRLSGGERQRVALARALLLGPRLVLMDEPTAHLDGGRVDELAELLHDLVRDGLTLFVTSHDPRLFAAGLFHQALELESGSLRATESAA
jgi:putative ABC transport system ATP-binding protein